MTNAVFLSNLRKPAGVVSMGSPMRIGRAGASGSKKPARSNGSVGVAHNVLVQRPARWPLVDATDAEDRGGRIRGFERRGRNFRLRRGSVSALTPPKPAREHGELSSCSSAAFGVGSMSIDNSLVSSGSAAARIEVARERHRRKRAIGIGIR